MSFTMDETTYNSPNYTPASQVPQVYGGPRTIQGVTVHWWGNPAERPTFDGSASYLCRPNGNTSAHFVVEAGRVACLVSPANAAWHAGSAEGNRTTIGIECNPRMSEGDIQTLVELIAWIEDTYGPMKVYGHRDWHNTACPGTYYAKLPEIISRVNAQHSKAPTKPAGGNAPAPSKGNTMANCQLRGFNGKDQDAYTVMNWFMHNTIRKLDAIADKTGAAKPWGPPAGQSK